MSLRDEAERIVRSWNAYEVGRGAEPVIDFDLFPSTDRVEPAKDRLSVYRGLTELRGDATGMVATRLDADLAYLGALLGERLQLAEYVQATQGCDTAGWPGEYVRERGEVAREALAALGVSWGSGTGKELERVERPIPAEAAGDAILQAAEEYEHAVRALTGADAPYVLTIESADVDAYWAFWLDGVGDRVRLRLNQRNARFTEVSARQFALHEVLGHGLQCAGLSAQAAVEDVAWIRVLPVHAPYQVTFEGLAQAMPLYVAPDDETLIARVRLDHYAQLVRAELHLAINDGASPLDCAVHARSRVPWWTDAQISDALADRSVNPNLRSYLWAYPAGIDWFAALAEADDQVIGKVLHAAYRAPLTPTDLATLWPAGPTIGGPGRSVRLRTPPGL